MNRRGSILIFKRTINNLSIGYLKPSLIVRIEVICSD
nr:MAG TPA: hypothetical protein [Caudoviricetes sp.]